MKILVVGGGGREHAIIKKIKENPTVEKIYALPGNGGIAEDAECVAIGAKEIDKIVEFAKEAKIDYAVVAPDDPLVLGCVDALEAVGIPYFFIRFLENILLPSIIAAFARGPKQAIPASLSLSTAPSTSGSSGATTA